MGKKLLSTFLFVPALAMAEAEVIHFESICADLETLENTVTKFGEKPFITAVGHRQIDNKKVYHPVVFFMNPETKSWSIVEKLNEDTYCMIALGSKMQPYFEKN